MRHGIRSAALASLLLLGVAAGAAPAPGTACQAARLAAAGAFAHRLLDCHGRAARKGVAVDPACAERAATKFERAFARAERKRGGCPSGGDAASVAGAVEAGVADVVAALRPVPDAAECAAQKLRATGRRAAQVLTARGQDKRSPNPERLAARIARAVARFEAAFAHAEAEPEPCLTYGDAGAVGALGAAIGDAVMALVCPP